MTSKFKTNAMRDSAVKQSSRQKACAVAADKPPRRFLIDSAASGKAQNKSAAVDTSPRSKSSKKRSSSLLEARSASSTPAAKNHSAASGRNKDKKVRAAANVANVANVASALEATAQSEQAVTLGNGSRISITGLRDEDDTRYIHFRQGKRAVTVRYDTFHATTTEASSALRQSGIIVVTGMSDIRNAVDQIKRFSPARIVSKPGGSRHGFAAANGQVYVADGQPYPLVTFKSQSGILDRGGTLAGWIEGVAAPLAEQLLPAFLMMSMFASPLLRWINRADNIGLEVSGAGGTGKSTCQYLIASAAGPAIGDGEATYWQTLNSTNNALEDVFEVYNDMTLILDEAGLVEGAGRLNSRATTMRDLAFRLSTGQPKRRFREPAAPRVRLVYILSTNQPIASLLRAAHAAEADAIADRLITLPILSDRPFGIFDRCPPSYLSIGDFAESLKRAAAENYGHAMPAYLSYLVNEAARRPKALRETIERYVTEFMRRAGTNTNDGSQLRVAQAIGLIYAGGKLAKAAGVLPSTYRCGSAALVALTLHRDHARPQPSFDDRLVALMGHADTIDLAKVEVSTVDEDERRRCPAFLYTGRSGSRELLVPTKHMDRVVPGWRALCREPAFVQRLSPPEGRLVRNRPVGQSGDLEPVYRFIVTDLDR